MRLIVIKMNEVIINTKKNLKLRNKELGNAKILNENKQIRRSRQKNFEVHELWIFLSLIKTVTSQNEKDQGHPPQL